MDSPIASPAQARSSNLSRRLATYSKVLAAYHPGKRINFQQVNQQSSSSSLLDTLCIEDLESVLLHLSRHPSRTLWAAYLAEQDLASCVGVPALLQGCHRLLESSANSECPRVSCVDLLTEVAGFLRSIRLTSANCVELHEDCDCALLTLATRATALRNLTVIGGAPQRQAYNSVLAAVGSRLHSLEVPGWDVFWGDFVIRNCPQLRRLNIRSVRDSAVGSPKLWRHVGRTLTQLNVDFSVLVPTSIDIEEQIEQIALITTHCRLLTHVHILADEHKCNSHIVRALSSYGAQLLETSIVKPTVQEATALTEACSNVRIDLVVDLLHAGDVLNALDDRVRALTVLCQATRSRRQAAAAQAKLSSAFSSCSTLERFHGPINFVPALLDLPKPNLAELEISTEEGYRASANLEAVLTELATNSGTLTRLSMTTLIVNPKALRRVLKANPRLRELRLHVGCRGVGSAMDYRGVDFSNRHDRFTYFRQLFSALHETPALEIAIMESMQPQRILSNDSVQQCDQAVVDAAVQLGHRKLFLEVDGAVLMPRASLVC